MARSLAFFQIYYEDWQEEHLYPFAIPIKNLELTSAFENDVIAKIVPQANADLISVCSWSLKRKRGCVPMQVQGRELTEEKICTYDYDVAILTPRSPNHRPLLMASQWHGKAWDDAIAKLREFIAIPKELKRTIYENHFIARGDLYKEYVDTCLRPCMDFMRGNPVFYAPSGYVRKKRAKPEEVARIKAQLGMDDWPIFPFILERLFSIWINDKDLKIIPDWKKNVVL